MNKCKRDYRDVFSALRADIKTYGGYEKASCHTVVTAKTLCNQVNPDEDVNPPTLCSFLELINNMRAERTVAAIANLADKITIDMHDAEESTECEIQTFLRLVGESSSLLNKGSDFAMDGLFDAKEREELLPLLMSLMQVTGHLYRKLNR